MEDEIQNYSPTVMFRGTPNTKIGRIKLKDAIHKSSSSSMFFWTLCFIHGLIQTI